MDSNELIDIYDATRKHLGTKSRRQVHLDGDWHGAFHCWIVVPGEHGQDCIVVQKRSSKVHSWAEYLDVSCGGHYLAGESAADGLRELEEETGIRTIFENLRPLGIRVCVDEYQPGIVNREFQDVFLLECNQDLTAYRPQCDEPAAFVKAGIQNLIDLFTGKVEQAITECVSVEPWSDEPQETVVLEVGKDDFIPTLDQYWLRMLLNAKRSLQGETCLHV